MNWFLKNLKKTVYNYFSNLAHAYYFVQEPDVPYSISTPPHMLSY
jgi:hypothetical protein